LIVPRRKLFPRKQRRAAWKWLGIFEPFGAKPPREYVSREELRLTALRLNGSWVEDDELFGKDTLQWHGSAFVMDRSDGDLILVTNSHCLALENLADADRQSATGVPASPYELFVAKNSNLDGYLCRTFQFRFPAAM
jgi:hypothetical protein